MPPATAVPPATPPRVLRADQVPPTPWRNGGGQTRELWRTPADGPWVARLSLADITQDGPFSAFAGVTRHFAVLEGDGVRLVWPGVTCVLTPASGPMVFPGEPAPEAQLLGGPTRDLNLMLQGGAQGALRRARPGEPAPEAAWRALWVTGPAQWTQGDGRTVDLPARSLALDLPPGPLDLRLAHDDAPAYWVLVTTAPAGG